MPRLIDADLFVAEIKERITNAIQWGKNATKEEIKIRAEQAVATFSEALLTARKMPTVDAEPVVRCKNCKYFLYDKLYMVGGLPLMGNFVCEKWGNGCSTDENGYCFLGERREDETD